MIISIYYFNMNFLLGNFLKMLISMIGAKRILEIGTDTGYSAIYMAEALPEGENT